jgi:hypothetical protein
LKVLKNDLGVEKRVKRLLITSSGSQADNMEILKQDTKLARLNTGTVAPESQT